MIRSLFSVVLFFFFNFEQCISINDVESISIKTTDDGDHVGPPTAITVTLWYNFTIYQFTLIPQPLGLLHQFYKDASPQFTVIGSTNYHIPNSTPETKLMIENAHRLGVIVGSVTFNTTSSEWYGIESICLSSSRVYNQVYINNHPDRHAAIFDASACGDGNTLYYDMCVDDESNDCAPYKQIIYFDTTRPNQYIAGAVWSNGTSVIPTHDPTAEHTTSNPTQDPTAKHTTSNPTQDPIAEHTTTLQYPSVNPTHTSTTSDIAISSVSAQIQSTEDYDDDGSRKKLYEVSKTFFIVIIILGLAIFLVFIVICILLYKMKRFKSIKEKMSPTIDQRESNQTVAPTTQIQKTDGVVAEKEESHMNTAGLEPDEFIVKGDDEVNTAGCNDNNYGECNMGHIQIIGEGQ